MSERFVPEMHDLGSLEPVFEADARWFQVTLPSRTWVPPEEEE